jgi:hypothetical protein
LLEVIGIYQGEIMKKHTIIILIAILIATSTIGGLYIKRKIAENKVAKEYSLVVSLNQEALEYVQKFITEIENGNYIRMSEMMKSEPEEVKIYGNKQVKYVDMQISREITNSNDLIAEYIVKFQNIDLRNTGEKKGFILVDGFYYLNIMLIKDNTDGWRIASVFTREYFN